MRLLVIDGNSIANRAFYGIKLLTTKDGRYTNAIFGFLNILLSLLKDAIIENARGYDAKDDRMSGNPNQMNIQSMYSDICLLYTSDAADEL